MVEKNVDALIQQFRCAISEYVLGGAVDPMNLPIQAGSNDRVGRGIDNGVIARVLPVAQDALAGHGDCHITDLQ